MTEAEMNSYRFGRGEEPTDEMLAQIMHEAVEDATKRSKEATRKYFEELEKGAATVEAKWADRINQLRNDRSKT